MSISSHWWIEHDVFSANPADIIFIPRQEINRLVENNPKTKTFLEKYATFKKTAGSLNTYFQPNSKFDKNDIVTIIQNSQIEKVGAGHRIFAQGNRENPNLYFIVYGQVELTYQKNAESNSIQILGPKEFFGEKTCLTGKAHQTSAETLCETKLIALSAAAALTVLEKNPRLFQTLNGKMEDIEQIVERQNESDNFNENPFLYITDSRKENKNRLIRSFPLIKRAEEADRAAACLAMVCRYYGVRMTVKKLKNIVSSTTEWASLSAISEIGKTLGFESEEVESDPESLYRYKLPFITGLTGYRFVVVHGISENEIRIATPCSGRLKMKTETFFKQWTGNCLLLLPENKFYSSKRISQLYPRP
jgi:ATP-binding cassette subfamily B protein